MKSNKEYFLLKQKTSISLGKVAMQGRKKKENKEESIHRTETPEYIKKKELEEAPLGK